MDCAVSFYSAEGLRAFQDAHVYYSKRVHVRPPPEISRQSGKPGP